MSTNVYNNQQVAEWARRNITQPVQIKTLFSSNLGKLFIYCLLFSIPGAFFLLGVVAIALGAKDPPTRYGPFVFSFLLLIPCCVIVLLGAYVRRGFAKSLDAQGVNGSMGLKHPWSKLYYVDHVTKRMRIGRVSRKVEDNQLELVFEGGKVIIPPLIHNREMIWALVNSIPVGVRDDGVPRAPDKRMSNEEALLAALNLPR